MEVFKIWTESILSNIPLFIYFGFTFILFFIYAIQYPSVKNILEKEKYKRKHTEERVDELRDTVKKRNNYIKSLREQIECMTGDSDYFVHFDEFEDEYYGDL
ncbi:hypothetical protein [Peijinzhouia sedimentorum]